MLQAAPEQVEYAYRLSGLDTSWSPPTSDRRVTYSSLAPGRYRFEVKAGGRALGWSASPVGLDFTIRSPFWATWQFRGSAILSGLLLLGSLAGWRERRLRRQRRLLEREVAVRTSDSISARHSPSRAAVPRALWRRTPPRTPSATLSLSNYRRSARRLSRATRQPSSNP